MGGVSQKKALCGEPAITLLRYGPSAPDDSASTASAKVSVCPTEFLTADTCQVPSSSALLSMLKPPTALPLLLLAWVLAAAEGLAISASVLSL